MINALLLVRIDKRSSHIVLKLNTKTVVSINRVATIPTPATIVEIVNQMGVSEKQPNGIQFMNMDMEVTVYNFDLNRDDNDDDSNASDEIFKHDNKY